MRSDLGCCSCLCMSVFGCGEMFDTDTAWILFGSGRVLGWWRKRSFLYFRMCPFLYFVFSFLFLVYMSCDGVMDVVQAGGIIYRATFSFSRFSRIDLLGKANLMDYIMRKPASSA